jgi:hypothetical protein
MPNISAHKKQIKKRRHQIIEWGNLGINYWSFSKCGSTSIKNSLVYTKHGVKNKQASKDPVEIHRSPYLKYISPDEAETNGFVNVCVVRHPYDRVLSLYRDFALKRPEKIFINTIVDKNKVTDLNYFIEEVIGVSTDKDDIHFRSYLGHLTHKGNIFADKIYKFENIDEFFFDFNLPVSLLNRTKKTNGINVKDLTSIQKKIIRTRYFEDFGYFKFQS